MGRYHLGVLVQLLVMVLHFRDILNIDVMINTRYQASTYFMGVGCKTPLAVLNDVNTVVVLLSEYM